MIVRPCNTHLPLTALVCAVLAAGCGTDLTGASAGDDGLVLGGTDAGATVDADTDLTPETDDGQVELVDVSDAAPDAAGPEAGPDPDVVETDAGADANSDDADTVSTDVSAPPISLRAEGLVLYEDRAFDDDGFTGDLVELPARGFRVQLLYPGDTVLAETFTDETGRWEVAATADGDADATVAVRVLADSTYGLARTTTIDRGSGAVFGLRRELGSGAQDLDVADVELIGRADVALGGAFNIVDVVWGAWDVMPELAALPSPRLLVAWQPGLPFSCGSCYSNNRISLGGATADPDEYDDDIILHEFAHFFVAHFGRDDSPGGPHRDRVVEPRLAYGEGLAYFLAGMFRNHPRIVDNFEGSRRLVDMEAVTVDGGSSANLRGTSNGTLTGDLREEIVAGVLWDAYDAASDDEAFDTIELGLSGSLNIVRQMRLAPLENVGVRGVDLADWLLAAACGVSASVAALDACSGAVEFPWDPTSVSCSGKGDPSLATWPDPLAVARPLRGARVAEDRGQLVLEFGDDDRL